MDAEKEQSTERDLSDVGIEKSIEIAPSLFRMAGWEIDESSSSNGRVKSSQRMRYEAEVGLIKRKLGDLEAIRTKLGLSQRKISQLLLVDPSAWTRWIKAEEDAPPHIYRMLQWYLALQDKYPALDVNFWLSTVARVGEPEPSSRLTSLEQELDSIREAIRSNPSNGAQLKSQELLRLEDLDRKLSAREDKIKKSQMWLISWILLFAFGVASGWVFSKLG